MDYYSVPRRLLRGARQLVYPRRCPFCDQVLGSVPTCPDCAAELEELRRNLEKEEDILEKEYQNLTSGKVLELPEELKKELDNMGIHIVYGMEWPKKNGYSRKKNQKLVRNNPFLPYALILSGQEIEKLGKNGRNICTSFPVPIVEREKIE